MGNSQTAISTVYDDDHAFDNDHDDGHDDDHDDDQPGLEESLAAMIDIFVLSSGLNQIAPENFVFRFYIDMMTMMTTTTRMTVMIMLMMIWTDDI